ncbi:MAG TPA: BlaI/MecI/CopY family transcriptional regulator [Candidatus Sumerlaeota bacterium]|nr:BlaI/MecI/CopY family transcriptional regulator [Candidatus Sumerlaeota bacterium]HPS00932.1 BlaI/MecI/CopY family transcriptional regulator [Candidatus Sumerlaeota bacterium]
MPNAPYHRTLSRREREIMEILYRMGEASVTETLEAMDDPPGYSAVRTMLRLLEEKGVIKHKQIGKKYVFTPIEKKETARRSVLRTMLETFFNNSIEETMVSLLETKEDALTDQELDRLSRIIEGKRKKDD